MSLTSFLARPDITELIKPLRPKVRRRLSVSTIAAPRSPRFQLLGTAFDYLLRFELLRRFPAAQERPWVSTLAPLDVYIDAPRRPGDLRDIDGFDVDSISKQMDAILTAAREAVESYRHSATPTRADVAQLAAHALRLARLDEVRRANFLAPDFAQVAQEDVDDLLVLHEVVPDSILHREGKLLLNPTFGAASRLVGGADADLILGDTLIDVKVTVKNELSVRHLDQLLGYFLLARHERLTDNSFPAIEHVGIYFARQAYLWTMPVTSWTQHPDFDSIERRFIELASERSKPRPTARELVQALVDLGYTDVVASSGGRKGRRPPAFLPRVVRDSNTLFESSGTAWRVILTDDEYALGPDGSIDMFRQVARELARKHPGAKVVRVRWRRRRVRR